MRKEVPTIIGNDGYPTNEILEYIESYDPNVDSIENFIYIIEDAWMDEEYISVSRLDGGGYDIEMHTIGWSGNEDVICAMSKSFFWKYLKDSREGGHYTFTYTSK